MTAETSEPDGRTPARAASVLVFGAPETLLAALSAALAERTAGAFAWADCAGKGSQLAPEVRARLNARAVGGLLETTRWREMESRRLPRAAVTRVVEPDSFDPEAWRRLNAFCRLPPFLQQLAARTGARSTPGALVVSGLQRVPRQHLANGIADRATLGTLADLGLALFVVYRGTPPPELHGVFTTELEVRSKRGRPWSEATIVSLGAVPPGSPAGATTLGAFADRAGLRLGDLMGDLDPESSG